MLLGFVESLLVAAVAPVLLPGAPRLNLLWLVGIFAYGVMTLVLVVVENAVLTRLRGPSAGRTVWSGRAAARSEAHR